jgi:serine phosphatase RsbU (regulator of sigma subunit)
METMPRIITWLLSVFIFATASAEPTSSLILRNGDSNIEAVDFSFTFLPAGEIIEESQLEKLQKLNFVSATKNLPNFGYSRGQLVAKFVLENQSSQADWILRLGNPHLKKLKIFELTNNQLSELFRTGVEDPFVSRPILFRDFWIPLKLKTNQKQTFFVLTESGQWLGLIPHLTRPSETQDIQNREWALQILGFGGIFFILLYNLFIYFVTRDRVYLYYVLASIAINILVIPGCSGLLVYVFPVWPVFAQDLWYASAIGWIALTALFAKGFLLKGTDALLEKKILKFSVWISAPLALIPFIFGPNYYIALFFNILSGIFQFIIFTIAWRAAFIRKYTPAFIFLAAWGVPILVAVVFVGATQGFYPVSNNILYALTASSVWEVVVMATALGYRIVVLQQEKDRTQASLMEKAILEGELQAARVVQEQLLPPQQEVPGLDFAAFFQPADVAGGDWYGYVLQKEHSRITFYIGDITGHGITSAVLTGLVCGAVYSAEARSAQLAHMAPPAEQLKLAAESLDTILLNTAGRSGRMMTMCFLSIDLATGKACALNAGHTWPILARYNNGEIRCEKIPGGGSLLGSGKSQFGIHEFSLDKGDTLLLYTDGLVENEGPGGEVLNFRKMRSLLTKPAPLEGIMAELETTVRSLWSGQKLADDVTFLGIRYQGL